MKRRGREQNSGKIRGPLPVRAYVSPHILGANYTYIQRIFVCLWASLLGSAAPRARGTMSYGYFGGI